ncbi:Carbohydrate acetyl esterase/feruloyl esterase precursor [Luteitalea pratensis]|uniref:Carbohydrate acetyl esterase/feruloyl esterase n=1 Tax=Luteitalea pratensis TaxID=1855912 RepID=A0A143PUY2_LUTPR|nr:esterase [Luteitalea pratensis]AMY11880.1 Carbohydrate acetyl esterase/feruloyl esterase precursor [Luteitalea pratensis]
MMQRGSSRPAARLVALLVAVALAGGLSSARVDAQDTARPTPTAPQPAPAAPPRPPQYVSPEVATDGRITFRIHAPNAQAVRVSAGDIQGLAQGASQMTKGGEGIWEVTLSATVPGSYRYNFNVDGVATIDPRNPATSESNTNTWSVVHVPGGQPWDTADVPHGAVASVTYKSTALGQFRRMHVYTPPGYETSTAAYPVFYLLHGAGDSDDSWTSVGRANFILDTLIAGKQATPMIVVMPAGHVRGAPGTAAAGTGTQDFANDFTKDVKPYIESHYRVMKGRANTAIAGLSMGGGQTLTVAIPNLEQYGYVGVYSSGLLGGFPDLMRRPPGAPAGPAPRMGPTAEEWTKMHAAKLADPALKKGLLLWFATGKDDFLLTTTQATVALFEKQGFSPVFRQTDGGHTWINWRSYLVEFAPQLFRGAGATSSARK